MTDDAGTIIWTASYAPFGQASINEDVDGDGSDYELNIRFPGQYFDQESGLHYNYFRDYNPGTGRYIESDPIGLGGGVNTFGYVKSNPLRWVDPTGLRPSCKGTWELVGTKPKLPLLFRLCICYWLCTDCTYPVMWSGIIERLPTTTGQMLVDYRSGGSGAGDIETGNACLCTKKPGPETGCADCE